MSDDLIKRSDAIEAVENVTWYHQNRNKDMVEGANSDEHQAWYKSQDIYEALEALPYADRPQEWIPCSERLPEEEGTYLVTFGAFAETINGEKVIFGDIDGSVSEIGYGCYERDIFWHPTAFGWYDLATATPFDKRAIIAWMPLPKPWKGADDE